MTAVEKVRDRGGRGGDALSLAQSRASERTPVRGLSPTRSRSRSRSSIHAIHPPPPLSLPPALQQEFGPALKVVKINADPAPGLVEKYKVYGLPTLIIFRDGAPVPGSQREGAINKAKLGDYLASHGLQAGVQA
jgi:hypothetical protein